MQLFDLHIHTVKGSSDSSMHPTDLLREARKLGLTGVCLTEHQFGWGKEDFERFAKEQEIVMIRAREIDSNMGHILVFGLSEHVTGIGEVETLRKVLDNVGGVMVSAHPFRHMFSKVPSQSYPNLLFNHSSIRPKTPQDALSHPLFSLVNDIEVDNGGNTEEENAFAKEVARLLNMKGTGGSDSHSPLGVGICSTAFDGDIRNEADFIEALKAKAFHPYGNLRAMVLRE